VKAAAIVVALAAAGACSRGRAAAGGAAADRPRRAQVTTGDLAARVLLTGQMKAANSVDLITPRTDTWELAIRWMAEDGAAVKAGERVLEFDNSAFANQLEQKRLAFREAESAMRSNRDVSALATADKEAEVRQHRTALEKAQLLADVPADLLPGRTAQERQLELQRAKVALESAEIALAAQRRSAALDQRVKQVELEKARRAIDEATRGMAELVVTAPRDGVVMVAEHPWEGRKLHVGDSTQPGWTVVSLPDAGAGLRVEAELSDVDDGKVDVGMVGTCTLDAYPEAPLPCTVKTITPVARSKGRESLRKAFDLALDVETREGQEARPGMSVKIELRRPPVKAALLVPRGAVRIGEGGARVRLPGGGARDVTLGPCDAQACVVEQGLAAGDAVEIGGGS
jgi:multidrug resistance efflux pump